MFEQPFSHIAIVVPDIEEAIGKISAALGTSFRKPEVFDGEQIEDPELRIVATRVSFSIDGPPYIELIEVDEGVYGPERMGLHHIGMWTSDHEGSREHLESLGIGMAAKLTSPEFTEDSAYYTNPDDLYGLSVEIVSTNSRDDFNAWMSSKQ